MVRYFCDVCGNESDKFERVRRKLGDVMIEVMVRYKGVWNAGHICASCVLKIAQDGAPAADGESYLSVVAKEKEKQRRAWATAIPQNVSLSGSMFPT